MKQFDVLTGELALTLLVFLNFAASSAATTFVVTKFEDDNGACTPDDCALREAVIAANTLPGADRIELPGGVYTLTIPGPDPVQTAVPEIGDLDIRDELELVGDPVNPTVIVGKADDRVVGVSFTTATFSNIEVTGGRDLLDSGGCVRLLASTVTFIDSSITNCFCENPGGGLAAFSSSATLINTTVSANVSNYEGGGIFHAGLEGELFLINSTISGNQASRFGGGIFHSSGLLSIIHSTIAGNVAPFGSAMFTRGQSEGVKNSILEGTCNGFLPYSLGGNLAGPDPDVHCLVGSHAPDDVAATYLGLGPLVDNGGPTKTHALVPGSPAIDAANPDHCEPTDERGVPRPQGAGCDIGAFETTSTVRPIPALGPAGLVGLAVLLLVVGVARIRLRA